MDNTSIISHFNKFIDELEFELSQFIAGTIKPLQDNVITPICNSHKYDEVLDKNIKLCRARKFILPNTDKAEYEFWKQYVDTYFASPKDKCAQKLIELTDKYYENGHCTEKKCCEQREKIKQRIRAGYYGYDKDEMGAPPEPPDIGYHYTNNYQGRADNEFSVLYLADTAETALSEKNAIVGDIFSIALFEQNEKVKPLKIFDFTQENGDPDYMGIRTIFTKEYNNLYRDNTYRKTTIIANYICKNKYNGIKYRSLKQKNGICYVIFDPANMQCTGSKLLKVENSVCKYTIKG